MVGLRRHRDPCMECQPPSTHRHYLRFLFNWYILQSCRPSETKNSYIRVKRSGEIANNFCHILKPVNEELMTFHHFDHFGLSNKYNQFNGFLTLHFIKLLTMFNAEFLTTLQTFTLSQSRVEHLMHK